MTEMQRYNENVQITDGHGGDLGSVDVTVESGDNIITMSVNDEDGAAHVPLSAAEAEALIAKLAVAVAYARQA